MFDRRVGRLGLGQVSNNEVHLKGLVKKRRNDEAIRKIGHLLRHPISEVWEKVGFTRLTMKLKLQSHSIGFKTWNSTQQFLASPLKSSLHGTMPT